MSEKRTTSELGPVAARAYLCLTDAWRLTPEERAQLLVCEPHEYEHFVQLPSKADERVLRRIGLLLGIHEALCSLFSNDAQARLWLRSSNTAAMFGGRTPMKAMFGDESELTQVRDYLMTAALGPI